MSQSTSDTSKVLDGSLDGFITAKKHQPEPIATSQEIRDRGSTFVANIYRASTPEDAKARVNHLKHFVHRSNKATHEIAAWRCMVLKPGKSGLEGPDDFELVQRSMDDGESWAGGKILKVMQNMAVIDAVVIVSRWYGGTMLGPARFSHIETCAAEVCKVFKQTEELRDHFTTLRTLDDILATLRKQLAETTVSLPSSQLESEVAPSATTGEPSETPIATSKDNNNPKKPDYRGLDVTKAKRLIQARESSIKSVRALISKSSSQT